MHVFHSLDSLRLSFNFLTGPIPTEISLLTQLSKSRRLLGFIQRCCCVSIVFTSPVIPSNVATLHLANNFFEWNYSITDGFDDELE